MIRNFAMRREFDNRGRMSRLLRDDVTVILQTGDADERVLDFLENPNKTMHGESTLSVLNVLMFALGAISVVVWNGLFGTA